MNVTLEDKVLDLLETNGEMSTKQIEEAIGKISRNTIYDCLKRLKKKGQIKHTRTVVITRGKHSFWEAIDVEPDFTPNRPYNGPSYTYFLQGIWNEPRQKTEHGA